MTYKERFDKFKKEYEFWMKYFKGYEKVENLSNEIYCKKNNATSCRKNQILCLTPEDNCSYGEFILDLKMESIEWGECYTFNRPIEEDSDLWCETFFEDTIERLESEFKQYKKDEEEKRKKEAEKRLASKQEKERKLYEKLKKKYEEDNG